MADDILTHPVQTKSPAGRPPARAPAVLTMRAYEVYCHVHQPQEAMVTGGCRGGFGAGELLALLYARSFPKEEWQDRLEEGLRGMVSI